MTETSEMTPLQKAKEDILAAAMPHVVFDGWTNIVLNAAAREAGVDADLAREAFPRGAIDLALFYHGKGDCALMQAISEADFTGMRFSEKVAYAVKTRLKLADKEAVRRGVTLFSLPLNLGDGIKATWSTVDIIWTSLGDTSYDVNWYTKRATLSGVYSSTVLYWIGDDSAGDQATWDFLDRRIAGVMQIEKVKGRIKDTPLGKVMNQATSWIKAPDPDHKSRYPGFGG